jgi:Raf kinase inhibitor-like YbhB/YbcL family protein
MRTRSLAISILLLLTLPGCRTGSRPLPPQPQAQQSPDQKSEIKVTSVAFQQGQLIPRQYTCAGINISPPLEWSGVPKTAKTIAIVADDPDAPAGTWVHWVLYNLPADNIGLVENVPMSDTLKAAVSRARMILERLVTVVHVRLQERIDTSSSFTPSMLSFR